MLPQDQGEPRLAERQLWGKSNRGNALPGGSGRLAVPCACDEMGTMAGKTGQGRLGEAKQPGTQQVLSKHDGP